MEAHKETLVYFGLTLSGTLLPIILGLLYYSANLDEWAGWNLFYKDGQFYLYSASLLTPSAYIFYTYKIKNTDWYSIMVYISGFVAFIASILYMLRLVGANDQLIFLRNSSILAFGITLFFYYSANYIRYKKVDVVGVQRKAVEKIKKDL